MLLPSFFKPFIQKKVNIEVLFIKSFITLWLNLLKMASRAPLPHNIEQ